MTSASAQPSDSPPHTTCPGRRAFLIRIVCSFLLAFSFAPVPLARAAELSEAAGATSWSEWFVLRENILARVRIVARMGSIIGTRWEFRVDPARIKAVPDLAGMNLYLTYRQTFPHEVTKGHGQLVGDDQARRVYFPAGAHDETVHREREIIWFPQDYTTPHETISWLPGAFLPTVETPANGRKLGSFEPVLTAIEVNSERMLRFSSERHHRDQYIRAVSDPLTP